MQLLGVFLSNSHNFWQGIEVLCFKLLIQLSAFQAFKVAILFAKLNKKILQYVHRKHQCDLRIFMLVYSLR